MKTLSVLQIRLLERVYDAISQVSTECDKDDNFLDVINHIVPDFNLSHLSLDELACQWHEATSKLHENRIIEKSNASKLIPLLSDIVDHNEKILEQEENIPSDVHTFTFEHNGQDIYDFFHDETLRKSVYPHEYYPIDKLKKVVAEWLLR
jgi:hypothetical protein